MDDITWILASRSPRRAQLLTEAGVVFEQIQPPYEDPPTPKANGLSPQDQAMGIALAKAQSLAVLIPHRAILAADTLIVLPDGSLAGTPITRNEARELILKMVHTVHQVVTGIALLKLGEEPVCLADTAEVRIGLIAETEIESYLQTNLWQGKAGGYNLFDRQQAHWPIEVINDDDPTTVVGLPMRRLKPYLELPGTDINENRGESAR